MVIISIEQFRAESSFFRISDAPRSSQRHYLPLPIFHVENTSADAFSTKKARVRTYLHICTSAKQL